MIFNEHSNLAGKHSFLSPSSYHWINYDEEKLDSRYANHMAAVRGNQLHAFASQAISLGMKLACANKTLRLYVNESIGFRMTPEQGLYYSENCFGTADAIAFRRGILRINDFKSGVTPASMKQLMVYAALFCLEYDERPGEISTELRIYQTDEVELYIPETEEIIRIMDTIIRFDKRIREIKAREGFDD